MRAFEFPAGELDERNAESTVIDLDSVVLCQKKFFDGPDGLPKWVVFVRHRSLLASMISRCSSDSAKPLVSRSKRTSTQETETGPRSIDSYRSTTFSSSLTFPGQA